MQSICYKLSRSNFFNQFIIGTILLAGIVVGTQTYKEFAEENASVLHFLDQAILAIFTVEALIKILAEGNRPLHYFKNPWNVFDFAIVVTCLLEPFLHLGGAFLPVLRLLRILRVLRLITAIPKLQLLVTCLLKKPALDVLCEHSAISPVLCLWSNGGFSVWRKRPHSLSQPANFHPLSLPGSHS